MICPLRKWRDRDPHSKGEGPPHCRQKAGRGAHSPCRTGHGGRHGEHDAQRQGGPWGLYRDPGLCNAGKVLLQDAPDIAERDVIVVDPMLATGGSASAAISFIKETGAKRIKLMSVIGAPEGVAKMQKDHPDVDIFIAALDDHLNENGYIVPGLGDAGDRIFGTEIRLRKNPRTVRASFYIL